MTDQKPQVTAPVPHVSLKKQPGVIWLGKTTCDFYMTSRTTPIRLAFTGDTVSHLDVVSEEKLQLSIKTFVEQNKLPPAYYMLVVGPDALFEKQLGNILPDQVRIQEKEFYDNAPFETVYRRSFPVDKSNTLRLAAFNGGMYLQLKQALIASGSDVITAIPYFVTGKNTFTKEIAQSILNKFESWKNNSIVEIQPQQINNSFSGINNGSGLENEEDHEKKKNSSLPLLGAVFITLLIVLGVLIYMQNRAVPAPYTAPAVKIKPSPTVAAITPTDSPLVGTPSAVLNSTGSAELKKTLKIQILNGSGIPGQAETVKKQLTTLDYQDITLGNNPGINSSKTLVIFSPKIPTAIKDEITNMLKSSFPNFSVQENTGALYDIVIITK